MVNREEFTPVRTALKMIDAIRIIYPDEFQWRGGDRKFFDTLMGTDKVREQLSSGESVDSIINSWENELKEFSDKRGNYLLY